MRQYGDPDHGSDAALGTATDGCLREALQQLTAGLGLRQQVGDGRDQQFSAEFRFGFAMAVRQEAEVADALKTGRQSVDKKPPNEFAGFDRHDLLLAFMPVVFPLERDLTAFVRHKPVIGYGYTMRVSAQIGERLQWPAERWFRIHHPFGPAQRGQEGSECGGFGEWFELPEELQFAVLESGIEGFEEQAAKDAGEHFHGKEVARSAGDPALVIGGKSTAGDDTV